MKDDQRTKKQIEQARRDAEEKYRVIFENAIEGIFQTTMDGHFMSANPALANIFGYDSYVNLIESVTDIGRQLYVNHENREEHLRLIDEKGHVKNFETQMYRKDGSICWVSINTRLVRNVIGEPMHYEGFLTDITERKQAEADKEKMEYQNRQLKKTESLGRMAGAIAHHFNNQMGVVIGNLEMVIDDLPQDAGAIKKLTTVMEAANRAAEMSNMMLVYLGQSSHRHEPIDFSEVCLRSISLIKTTIANNVIMNHDLPTTGPVINANVNQIRQVIINLTNNAVEAIGEDGGVIKLKIKTVHPAEIPSSHRYPLGWQPQDNPYACLKVSDTGGGITNNDIENLFDPFFSRKLTGRGLGLPVVLGILRTHNGAITVDSKMGHGSIFQAFFPISGDILQQPDKGGKNDDILINTFYNAEMTGGVTLLLVEDEEIVRNMAAEMIKRLGYSVIEARDGIEAMEVFRHHQNEIHCVLSDLTMPRMNGWETLTALRKLAPNIPVILASGYDESHVMSGEHTELPQVFLGKPYKLKVLKEAISQALARRK